MSKTTFIANIGQRDLQLNHEDLAAAEPALALELRGLRSDTKDGKPNLRAWGHKLDDAYAAVSPFLSAPLLVPVLRDLRERNERPTAISFVATKQRDKTFMRGDTFTCAEVLVRLLKDRFADLVGDAEIRVELIGEAPHDLDAMLGVYRELCTRVGDGFVHALCTGGTPACNMALSLCAIERFGDRCAVLHVAEGSGTLTRLSVGKYVLSRHRRYTLERLVQRRDFDAIANDDGYSDGVRRLARGAAARMNFDFETSLREFQGIKGLSTDITRRLVDQAKQLAGGRRDAVMRDVFWNAVTKWNRDECADFLSRVWRLQEATLHGIIGAVIGKSEERFDAAFSAWAESQPDSYRKYVREKTMKRSANAQGQPYRIRATVPVLTVTFNYFLKYHPEKLAAASLNEQSGEELRRTVETLRPLTDLRNQSVNAHGFGGLSKSRILKEANVDNTGSRLLDCLTKLLRLQGIEVGDDPYDILARAILSMDGEI